MNEQPSVISQDVRDTTHPDRNLALELVRVTEAAALAAARWVGRGDKEAADQAAVDAMRLLLDTVPMDGLVVIGEGEKDEAPMLYNGESIGTWEGNELVVDTIGFRGDHHWMDQGGRAIPAGEKLHIVERFRMVGDQLEIEYTMTDPDNWEGEWKSTKRFNRVIDEDIQEVSCLPDLNQHLQSTTSKTQVFQ